MGCVIFFFEGHVARAPTVQGAAALLREAGVLVHIHWQIDKTLGAAPAQVTMGLAPGAWRWLRRLAGSCFDALLGPPRCRRISQLIDAVWFYLTGFFEAWRLARGGVRITNIAIDVHGALLGHLCQVLLGQRFILVSLELEPLELYFAGVTRSIRPLARRAMSRAAAVAIQDQDRAATFRSLYQCGSVKFFMLPNAPRADEPAARGAAPAYDWHQKLSIDRARFPIIALHAGIFNETVLCRVMARGFRGVPRCALVLHSSAPEVLDPVYLAQLRAENAENLFLSIKTVPYDAVGRLFAGATIGVAFYKAIDANYTHIGMASGKIAQCLRYGKPLITNNLPSLAKLVEGHKLGVVVRDPGDGAEVARAVERVMENYDEFAANGRAFFASELDFTRNFAPIQSEMKRLAAL